MIAPSNHGPGPIAGENSMNTRFLSVAVALLLLAGCSASSTQLVPMPAEGAERANPEMTIMYLFRVPGSLSPQAPLHINISGKDVGWIGGGYYLKFEMPPGLHNIRMELKRDLEKNLVGTDYGDVKPGKVYYGEIDFPISKSRRPKLTALSEREGKARIASMKPAKVQ
jgi:hypothetical protein